MAAIKRLTPEERVARRKALRAKEHEKAAERVQAALNYLTRHYGDYVVGCRLSRYEMELLNAHMIAYLGDKLKTSLGRGA